MLSKYQNLLSIIVEKGARRVICRYREWYIWILGPNGAGKTTLMRCIVGLLEYEGDIYYKGEDLNNTKGLNIGYLPPELFAFHNLTVKEALEYVFILKNARKSK